MVALLHLLSQARRASPSWSWGLGSPRRSPEPEPAPEPEPEAEGEISAESGDYAAQFQAKFFGA